jgi:putative transposase
LPSASERGIALTGEGGLLTALTKQVLQSALEAALEAEMAHHLGYDKHDPAGRGSGNSRNGTTPKTVTTEIGNVTVEMPRDRAGTFETHIVPKHQRRLSGFDEAVISLYAKAVRATSQLRSQVIIQPWCPTIGVVDLIIGAQICRRE